LKNTVTITLILCICFSGCEKNVEEDHVDCSAVETYYTENVAPILSSNCIGCHSASADLPLDSYTNVYSAIKSRNVLDRVNRDDELLMPQGGPKLSQPNLDTLQTFFNMECSE